MPTKFQNKVYELCKKVPKGKVTTYGVIAKVMKTRAYRAVGTTLNKNPFAPIVPCHRIINSSGFVGQFGTGIKNKIRLLNSEGVNVDKNKKVDLKRYLFQFK